MQRRCRIFTAPPIILFTIYLQIDFLFFFLQHIAIMILIIKPINKPTASTITAANAASIVPLNAAPIITPIIPTSKAASIAITKSMQGHFLLLQVYPFSH